MSSTWCLEPPNRTMKLKTFSPSSKHPQFCCASWFVEPMRVLVLINYSCMRTKGSQLFMSMWLIGQSFEALNHTNLHFKPPHHTTPPHHHTMPHHHTTPPRHTMPHHTITPRHSTPHHHHTRWASTSTQQCWQPLE